MRAHDGLAVVEAEEPGHVARGVGVSLRMRGKLVGREERKGRVPTPKVVKRLAVLLRPPPHAHGQAALAVHTKGPGELVHLRGR